MKRSGPALQRLEILTFVASFAFAILVVAATLAHLLQLRGELYSMGDARLRTLSRVLAQEVARSFANLESDLAQLDPQLAEALTGRGAPGAVTPTLQSVLQREILLRELAIVDGSGRIVASTQSNSVGRDVSAFDFVAQSTADQRRFVGIPKPGRTLASESSAREGAVAARSGYMTFSRRIAGTDARLVAVIGADSLINDLRYLAGGEAELIALYRYDGALLAASEDWQAERSSPHPIFTRWLPDRETGSFTETVGDRGNWIVHFSTTNAFPILVETRMAESALLAELPGRAVLPLGVMTAIVLALLVYTRTIAIALKERRRNEDALRDARDAAEQAVQAKSRFLAAMSHELRTPMTGIFGMIDLLGDSPMQPEQKRLLQVLHNSTRSLMVVLDAVLDYSKYESDRLELERIAFDPFALVREVNELMSPAAADRGNQLHETLPTGPLPQVEGDPNRLRQVLTNLVGNAIKFTESGTVSVSISLLPAASEVDALLRFEIRDTGIGIAADVVPTLFEPFRQADSSTSRRFGGTGLGLAICRSLVDAMGGRIGVETEPGRGSCFWFELSLPKVATPQADPVAQNHAPIQPTIETLQSENPISRVRPLHILIAEDNPTNRLLLGMRLRRFHQVDMVDDGGKAIEAARNKNFDLVLMDIQMPGVDGFAATRAIRAMQPGGHCPVIVALTADVLPESRAEAIAAGVDGYLSKPIDWHELDRILAKIMPMPAPSADPAAARPDESAVAAARENLGEDVHEAVLDAYWPEAALDLGRCRDAVAAGDRAGWKAAAHSLKGASVSLGLDSVGMAAAKLETSDADTSALALERLEFSFTGARAAWSLSVSAGARGISIGA